MDELVASVDARLRALGRAHRAGTVDGRAVSRLKILGATVPDVREVVREVADRLADASAPRVHDVARGLVALGTLEARQVAYELIGRREDLRRTLGVRHVEALGAGNDNWKSVDVFATQVAGPCWREGRLSDSTLRRWARSRDRWWRRTALAATVVLNTKSRGGRGDAARTLALCALCVDDRDDMVVKACSWALRKLSELRPDAVRSFVREHASRLAPRVRREVEHKLQSGRKHPRP